MFQGGPRVAASSVPAKEIAGNRDQFEGQCKKLKDQVKSKCSDLADDDRTRVEARHDGLVGVVQKKCGRAKEDAEREVDDGFRAR